MSTDAVPEAAVPEAAVPEAGGAEAAVPEAGLVGAALPARLDPQLDGQLSINDILLELGQAPVVHPSPDAASELHFF
jgi:hypothetical protein